MSEDTYPNAGRDSGYTDAEGKPVGENVINRVTELLLPVQTKLTLGLGEIRSDIAELARQRNDDSDRLRMLEVESQNRATYFYNRMDKFLKDADAKFQSYDAFFGKFDEVVSRLGGLETRIERVEVGQVKLEIKVESLETQGAPATAVTELHQLRGDVEAIRALLILTRRQLWLTFAAVTAIALVFLVALMLGGAR